MKKYQITPYGSQTPAAECDTLPQAAKTIEALKLETLRSSGDDVGNNFYITFSDERHTPAAEIHGDKIYYTYSGVHYVNRAQIVDTIPPFLLASTKWGYFTDALPPICNHP